MFGFVLFLSTGENNDWNAINLLRTFFIAKKRTKKG